MERYDDWKDIVEDLDANADLTGKSQDFIIHLIEDPPRYLSERQLDWLKDLRDRYLVG